LEDQIVDTNHVWMRGSTLQLDAMTKIEFSAGIILGTAQPLLRLIDLYLQSLPQLQEEEEEHKGSQPVTNTTTTTSTTKTKQTTTTTTLLRQRGIIDTTLSFKRQGTNQFDMEMETLEKNRRASTTTTT
jgi:hypothetical protein